MSISYIIKSCVTILTAVHSSLMQSSLLFVLLSCGYFDVFGDL